MQKDKILRRKAVLPALYLIKRYMRRLKSYISHTTAKKLINLALLHLQAFLRTEKVKGFPYIVQIEPTNICQLKCPTCPTGLGKNPDPVGKMALEDFKKIIDQMKEHLYEILLFGFGEPLLHKDIYKMIRYAVENSIRTNLSTNLCDFKQKDVDKLINSGLELLVVSLDGLTQETYRKYRVKGDVEKVKQNIERIMKRKKELKKSNPVIQIQFIIMDHNQHEIEEAKEFSQRNGVEEFILKDFGPKYIPSVGENGNAKEKARHLRDELYMCRKLWTESYISWNGDVRPCCLTFNGAIGNLLTENFVNIWNNNTYTMSRRIFGNRIDNIPEIHIPCLDCHLLSK